MGYRIANSSCVCVCIREMIVIVVLIVIVMYDFEVKLEVLFGSVLLPHSAQSKRMRSKS